MADEFEIEKIEPSFVSERRRARGLNHLKTLASSSPAVTLSKNGPERS
jgi:hypothetical protein